MIVEKLFSYFFGIYKKIGCKNPSIFTQSVGRQCNIGWVTRPDSYIILAHYIKCPQSLSFRLCLPLQLCYYTEDERRRNEFFAGWLYFSGRNADRQSFFCMLFKTLLPHLTISSLARLYYTAYCDLGCVDPHFLGRHQELKLGACGCVSSNLVCWRARKKRRCCFSLLQ